MAHSWGVDYIEPDVVLTKDNHLILLHDIYLEETTDIKQKYPKRKREDNHYYAIDFTLKEIKQLNTHERTNSSGRRYFKNRFPLNKSSFKIPTLKEFIELVEGLNQTTSKNIGIYLEIKRPEFHKKEGKDITEEVYRILKKYKRLANNSKTIIQCFNPKTLKRLRNEFKIKIPLIQLIADNSWKTSDADYKKMLTKSGLREVATYANGIGPWFPQLVTVGNQGQFQKNNIVKWAHENKLVVHPYVHRSDQLPPGIKNDKIFFDFAFKVLKVDGIFSDFADKVVSYLED